MSKKNNYPYQDLVTPTLPNEVWKDIRSFEYYYQVSNLGRVRSLDREIPHPRLKKQFISGRILKQKVVIDHSQLGEEGMVSLQVTLSKENTTKFKNVRRLVYSTFVKPLNFQKDGLYVINIDYNGYNNQLKNLELVTKQVKSQRAFLRKRVPESHLNKKYRVNWSVPSYGGVANRKPIKQLDPNTKEVIKTHISITHAAKDTGMDSKEIINTAKGRRKEYGGFIWRYVSK